MKKQLGATMAEYVLMVALIAIALIAVIILFQGALIGNFEKSADCVTSAVTGSAEDCPGAQPPESGN